MSERVVEYQRYGLSFEITKELASDSQWNVAKLMQEVARQKRRQLEFEVFILPEWLDYNERLRRYFDGELGWT